METFALNAVPTKALILAAGFGTRLLPLTRIVPKPLLPLRGVPMLDRALAMVRSWGVQDVVVNVHHGADALVRHIVERKPDGLRIQISFEPEILGTGGALTKASWFFSDGKPFWIVNADVAADVRIEKIVRAFTRGRKPSGVMAAAWLMASRGPRTVECRDGMITTFETKTRGAPGTFTFCGVHLVDPEILRYLPAEGFSSIIDGYKKAMTDGWRIAGVPIEDAYWADIGTPDQYFQAESEMAGPVIPSASVRVDLQRRCIYGPGVELKPYQGIMALRASDALDEVELDVVKKWARSMDRAIACPLAPRGSARTFTRIVLGKTSTMLVRHKPDREENNLYAGHSRFLASLGLQVPRVIAEDPANHVSLFEDVGVTSVQDLAADWTSKHLATVYRKVLDALVVFHEEGARAANRKKLVLMPPFDEKLYAWEHDLFCHLFLRDFANVPESAIDEIKKELQFVARQLIDLPLALVHRDLQSSNIILRGRQWSLIDYQGMRLGPAVYDLASLLCDPYITISPALREALVDHYALKANPASRTRDMFWPAAVQRLGQALGAYARLSKLPGTGHFVRYMKPALRNLTEASGRVEGLQRLRDVVEGLHVSSNA